MADIVLNKRDAQTQQLQSMHRNIVESILHRLEDIRYKKVNLHADWSEAPDYSKWLLEQLYTNNVHVTLCSNSIDDLSIIDQFVEQDMAKELCLSKETSSDPIDKDSRILNGLKFFLPIDIISLNGSAYMNVINKIPSFTDITLGINWQTRLSGPAPIEEDEYQEWATTIISLIGILSKKRIKSTIGCGVKLCIFTKDQIAYLANKLIEWPLGRCNHSFFYDVDGALTPCMRLDLPENLNFNYETNLKEATVAFADWLSPFTGHCMESDNLSCRSLKTNACSTGCFDHSEDEWQST